MLYVLTQPFRSHNLIFIFRGRGSDQTKADRISLLIMLARSTPHVLFVRINDRFAFFIFRRYGVLKMLSVDLPFFVIAIPMFFVCDRPLQSILFQFKMQPIEQSREELPNHNEKTINAPCSITVSLPFF